MSLVPRWQVPMKARIAWACFLAAAATWTGVIVALDQYGKASWPFVHNPWTLGISIIGLALLTFGDSVRRAFLRLRAEGVEKKQLEVRTQLTLALISIADHHKISVEELGCGLFLMQERWLKRPARLVRTMRIRLPDDLHESPVEFTIGKGAVGLCWKKVTTQHRDWRGINARYADAVDVESRWSSMKEETKNGFTLEEFVTLLGKYAEVLAVPIVANGSFIGCVALDRKWNPDEPQDVLLLADRQTKKLLGTTAQTLVPALTG